MTDQVQTRCATLTRIGANEVEIRFASGILLDRADIAGVIGERKRMCDDTPTGLLLIVPSNTELDVAIINTDHHKVNQATENVLGFAVVAGSTLSETMLRLYKAYYPTVFRSEVFTDEVEARKWLSERVAEAMQTLKG